MTIEKSLIREETLRKKGLQRNELPEEVEAEDDISNNNCISGNDYI